MDFEPEKWEQKKFTHIQGLNVEFTVVLAHVKQIRYSKKMKKFKNIASVHCGTAKL